MDTLYKYVTAKRAMTCLPEVGDGALRATQPSALNDPFECAVEFRDNERQGAVEEEQIDLAYARGLTSINEDKPITHDEVRLARASYGSLYARELLASQLSTRFGIVSFCEDYLNLLMWSHYTVDGSGLAIGYDIAELRKLGRTENDLRRVTYDTDLFRVGVTLDEGEYAGSRSRNLDWGLPLSRKSPHWEYEREWRLIVELSQTIGTGQTDAHGQPINLVRVPNEAVVRLYYTERTPRQAIEEVKRRLADPNNRYTAECPQKLVLSRNSYAYIEE